MSGSARPWLAAAVGALLFKLWLVGAQTLAANGWANHDDRLFLKLAGHLLTGQWLGPYDQLTLAKGPAYPLFLAATFLSGLPLLLAQHLFYALAVAVLVHALRPWFPQPGWRWLLFVVLLFNPVTFDAGVHLRVLRQGILHTLALLALAGGLGLWQHITGDRRRASAWGALGGLAFAGFWLTREEGVWLLPLAGAVLGAAILRAWRSSWPERALRAAIPLAVFALVVGGVSALNAWHYGAFTTCEFRHPDFAAAYGALTRPIATTPKPYVPVTREVRERLYPLSPAWAELQPHLEGQLGTNWAGASEYVTHEPPERREIGGGWFMWALRDAVAAAGHARNAGEAMAFYRRLAEEVNTACDSGRIPARGRRAGFLPPLGLDDLPILTRTGLQTAWYFATFQDCSVAPPPSQGAGPGLNIYRDLTRERLSPLADGPRLPPAQRIMDGVRLRILGSVTRLYQLLILPAGAVALAAFLWFSLRRPRTEWFWWNAALLLSLGASIGISTLVTVTSFPTLNPGSFTAGYALWLLFLFSVWRQGRAETMA